MEFRGLRNLVSGVFLFAFFAFNLSAQVGDPLSGQILRYRLAQAWAPTAFHDTASEFTQPETGFNPIDNLVGIFYDGNKDLRDNCENLFRLNVSQIEETKHNTPVYFSVIETESHFYLNYMFYHAVDAGAESHVHDTENVWVIVEKDGSPFGKLVMELTNAHGFGMIYGPDRALQQTWRSHLPDDSGRKFLEYLDRYSKDHNEKGEAEYIQREHSQSFKIFIASKSHAIYKFNDETWRESERGSGIIFVPAACDECIQSAFSYQNDIRPYSLVDWDAFTETNLITAQLDEGQKEAFFKIFTDLETDADFKNDSYRQRQLPSFLAAGNREDESQANLFYRTSLHSPYDLQDPVKTHEFFAQTRTGISQKYLFNTYLDEKKAKPMDPRIASWVQPFRRASIFTLVSELWETKTY
ncbi:MAG: hypothetical protein JWQ35_1446 [Bacteriovoracaceae bacterium]|nr:hypothetical protein [Bacteriovoracaceae bacterium]